ILIVLGFLCGVGLPAVFGIIALVQMDSDPYSAQRMNKVGWIVFWAMLGLLVLFIIAYVLFILRLVGAFSLPFLRGACPPPRGGATSPTPDVVLSPRERIGHELLWMPGVTALVLARERTRMLAVRRADDDAWTPVTGIIDPGEAPARAAVREVAEEAGIDCRALRLVDVRTLPPVTYPNGDRAQYLDLCFLRSEERRVG